MLSNRLHITITTLCLAVILLFAWYIQTTLYVNWDAGYLLHATELFLNGGTYTNDFFTPNTPMIFYLYMPPVIAKSILNVGIITSFQFYIFTVCTVSLIICYHLLQRIINPEDNKLVIVLLATLAGVYYLLPLYEFGQRDHLYFVLTFPYLLMTVLRLQEKPINKYEAMLVGFMTALGIGIKPQFMITPLLIELYYAVSKKSLLGLLRVEIVTLFFTLVIYAASVLTLHPEYLHVILPFLYRNYYHSVGLSILTLTNSRLVLFCLMSLLLTTIPIHHNNYRPFKFILAIGLFSYLIAYYAQHTQFYYHLVPALSAAWFYCLFMFYCMIRNTQPSRSFYVAIAFVTLLSLINSWFSGSTFWHSMIFFKKTYITFLTLFILVTLYWLFDTQKTSKTIMQTAVIMLFSWVLSELIMYTPLYNHQLSLTLALILCAYFATITSINTTLLIKQSIITILGISMMLIPLANIEGIYNRSYHYKTNMLNDLIKFVDSRQKKESLYFFSILANYNYPLLQYTNATNAQRFDCLWPVAGMLNDDDHRNRAEQIADKLLFIHFVTDDLKYKKPTLVFVDKSDIKYKANVNNFDYISFFSTSPYFSNEWKNYRYLKTISINNMMQATPIDVYERITS